MCGDVAYHEWAPTSQCGIISDPTRTSPSPPSSPSLFSQSPQPAQAEQSQTVFIDSEEASSLLTQDLSDSQSSSVFEASSLSSWGNSRLRPSLVEQYKSSSPDRYYCDGNCATAKRLREQIKVLQEENQTLNQQVPGYPDYFNIVYNGDQTVYVYQLGEDYRKGDLRVLVH